MTHLATETVCDILRADGTAEEIAKRFRVSRKTVYRIKQWRTRPALWLAAELRAHGEPVERWPTRVEKPTKLGPRDVAAIKASGEVSRVLAERYGVSASMIRMIRTGRCYR